MVDFWFLIFRFYLAVMRGVVSCLEVMLVYGVNVMSTDGAGIVRWVFGEGGGI